MRPAVLLALRLGWTLAEVRGRTWQPDREEGRTPPPDEPEGVLPLRSQRTAVESLEESRAALSHLLDTIGVPGAVAPDHRWPHAAVSFHRLDAVLQDALAARDDQQANAYLLGRGLAECYWGLGPATEGEGASLAYLLGEERVGELERMLGRLPTEGLHVLTPASVAGSLHAWAEVATKSELRTEGFEEDLREQVRRWYQLLVLGQDPTTMVPPGAGAVTPAYVRRTLRTFWPQVALAVLALVSLALFPVLLHDERTGLSTLLGTGGAGALLAAGALGRGKSAAQRLVLRARQDAYTDLVASAVTVVPRARGESERDLLARLERAVRERALTLPTPPPA